MQDSEPVALTYPEVRELFEQTVHASMRLTKAQAKHLDKLADEARMRADTDLIVADRCAQLTYGLVYARRSAEYLPAIAETARRQA